jgi:ubiquinone/menaquinone biosynthesis C-methylase UbiE
VCIRVHSRFHPVSIYSQSAVASSGKVCRATPAKVDLSASIRGIKSLMKSSTERFSDRVESYARYRPRYPDALLNYLAGKISPPATVADIGSGTGILSDQLLQFGYQVVAVEPNKPMREAAERRLSGRDGFRSVDGTAENTNLPSFSVDAITCAQSFHWFDRAKCRTEFERILRPRGLIALIWNERAQLDPLMQQYDEVLTRFVPGYTDCSHRRISRTEIQQFSPNGGFELFAFPNHQFLARGEFLGRVISSSYVPLAGEPGHEALVAACNALFDRFAVDGSIHFRYETQLYCGCQGVK